MAEWLDYTLADFLLFLPETYWRLFERVNTSVWPLQPILLATLTITAITAVRGWRHAGLAAGLTLAACWALVAHLFLATHYRPINWIVSWVLPLAWVQAALVLVLGPRLYFQPAARTPWFSVLLIASALLYPVLGALAGRPLLQAEVAGLSPDPTAMLTIGIMTRANRSFACSFLCVLPLAWLLFSTATLLAMGEQMAFALGSLTLLAVIATARMISRR